MRPDWQSTRVFLGALGGLGARSVTGSGPVTDRATITVATDTPVPAESYTSTPMLEPLDSPTVTGTPASNSAENPPPRRRATGRRTPRPGFGIGGALTGGVLGSVLWRRHLRDKDE